MAEGLVWYCCYGSNLSRDRFICYIKGGTPRYGQTNGRGCKDKKFLDQSLTVRIPYSLYFGLPKGRKATQNWGPGGVAFLDRRERPEPVTLGRLWKVTSKQFHEIWEQEGTDWYNDLIKLPDVEGLPVFTFTRRRPGLNFTVPPGERPPDVTVLKPSQAYLKTIIWGLLETIPEMTQKDIIEYIGTLEGIQGEYEHEELLDLFLEVELDVEEG